MRWTLPIFGLLVTLGFSRCSFYNVFSTAEVRTPWSVDSVDIFMEERDYDKTESFLYLGMDRAEVTLDNYQEGHVLRAECEGYFPVNLPVFRERLNWWKSADLLIGASMIDPLVTNEVKPWGSRQWTQAISLFYNVLGLAASPWRVYSKSYELPDLKPLPVADDLAPPVWIEAVHILVPEGQHHVTHYRTRDAFYNNRIAFDYQNDEDILFEGTNLDEEAIELLWSQGYQGPGGSSLFTSEDEVMLEAAVISVKETQVGNLAQYGVRSAWWVHNPYGLNTDTVLYFHRSPWGFASAHESPFDRQALADVIAQAAFEAAENPILRAEAARKDSLEAEWKADWEPILLNPVQSAPGKLSSALASIVTIEDEYGHGSGCILSEDGYILTNHHVVLDTAAIQTIHFHDGSSRIAELVRYHPLFDLALLKVDTMELQPFMPELDEVAVEVGDDVFAMGTPYDVALGASVTRGIVSAMRKDGKRQLIQTDVSISPGNSGGALVRADGTLVGVVNEKVMELGVEGIGFAIPLHYLEEALMVRYLDPF